MNAVAKGAISAIVVVGFYMTCCYVPVVVMGPGVKAPNIPAQDKIGLPKPFQHDDFTIIPVANYVITAKILSRNRFYIGSESNLSPIDLALGWGNMSDEKILESIEISQSGRFYYWKCETAPIPLIEIVEYSANVHIVPSDDDIKDKILNKKTGELVTLQGYLINATKPNGWHWNSSTTRKDTGAGACEIFWVTQCDF